MITHTQRAHFKKIGRVSISERIIEYVKSQILTNRLKPGDRLPAEEKLAEQMGVGRGTVREALGVLVYIEFLERRHNKTYVSEKGVKNGSSAEISRTIGRFKDYMQIIEVRRIIEPELAALAAVRGSEEQIAKIGEEYRLMARDKNSLDQFVDDDNRFHQAVFHAAGNSLFIDIIKTIQKVMKNNQDQVLKHSDIKLRSLDYHKKIYEAIRNSNAQLARQVMLDHIQDIEKEMKTIFKKRQE